MSDNLVPVTFDDGAMKELAAAWRASADAADREATSPADRAFAHQRRHAAWHLEQLLAGAPLARTCACFADVRLPPRSG